MTTPTKAVPIHHPSVLHLLSQVYGILIPLADLIDEGITFYSESVAEVPSGDPQTLSAQVLFAGRQVLLTIAITQNTIELANEEAGIHLHLTRQRSERLASLSMET